MEIAAQIQNFAYYHNSAAVYATVEVLEKNINQEPNNFIDNFRSVSIGQKINLIYKGGDINSVLNLFQNRILKIQVSGVEVAQNPKNLALKFVIESIQKCGLLTAN